MKSDHPTADAEPAIVTWLRAMIAAEQAKLTRAEMDTLLAYIDRLSRKPATVSGEGLVTHQEMRSIAVRLCAHGGGHNPDFVERMTIAAYAHQREMLDRASSPPAKEPCVCEGGWVVMAREYGAPSKTIRCQRCNAAPCEPAKEPSERDRSFPDLTEALGIIDNHEATIRDLCAKAKLAEQREGEARRTTDATQVKLRIYEGYPERLSRTQVELAEAKRTTAASLKAIEIEALSAFYESGASYAIELDPPSLMAGRIAELVRQLATQRRAHRDQLWQLQHEHERCIKPSDIPSTGLAGTIVALRRELAEAKREVAGERAKAAGAMKALRRHGGKSAVRLAEALSVIDDAIESLRPAPSQSSGNSGEVASPPKEPDDRLNEAAFTSVRHVPGIGLVADEKEPPAEGKGGRCVWSLLVRGSRRCVRCGAVWREGNPIEPFPCKGTGQKPEAVATPGPEREGGEVSDAELEHVWFQAGCGHREPHTAGNRALYEAGFQAGLRAKDSR